MDTQYKLELAEAIMESDMSNTDKYQMLQVLQQAPLDEGTAFGAGVALATGAFTAGLVGMQVVSRTATRCRRRCALLVGPRRGACIAACRNAEVKGRIQVLQSEGMRKCAEKRNPDKCRRKIQNEIRRLQGMAKERETYVKGVSH